MLCNITKTYPHAPFYKVNWFDPGRNQNPETTKHPSSFHQRWQRQVLTYNRHLEALSLLIKVYTSRIKNHKTGPRQDRTWICKSFSEPGILTIPHSLSIIAATNNEKLQQVIKPHSKPSDAQQSIIIAMLTKLLSQMGIKQWTSRVALTT